MHKHNIFIILLLTINTSLLHHSSIRTAAAYSALAGVFNELYYWRTPDTTMPTLEQLNVVTLLPCGDSTGKVNSTDKKKVLKALRQKQGTITIYGKNYKIYSGIPKDISKRKGPTFIYSGGYSNNGNPYAYCVYTALKCNLIAGPCITFDYATDTRRAFNFCQKQDIHCLRLVYEDLFDKAPHMKVILHGACKGAMVNLRFLESTMTMSLFSEKGGQFRDYLANVKGVIAESPVISVQKALSHWKNGGALSHLLYRFSLPNYNPKSRTIMEATQFPRTIPILIASLPEDTLSQHKDMLLMCEHLKRFSNNITHFTSKKTDIWHGKIGKAPDYREAVKEFFYHNKIKIQWR